MGDKAFEDISFENNLLPANTFGDKPFEVDNPVGDRPVADKPVGDVDDTVDVYVLFIEDGVAGSVLHEENVLDKSSDDGLAVITVSGAVVPICLKLL